MKRAFVAGSKKHIKRNVTNLVSESLQSERIVSEARSVAHWTSHRLQHDNERLCNQRKQKRSLTGSAGAWDWGGSLPQDYSHRFVPWRGIPAKSCRQ